MRALFLAHIILFVLLSGAAMMASAQDDEWDMGGWEEEKKDDYRITGFVEGSLGYRLSSDEAIDGRITLSDLRAQLQVDKDFENSRLKLSVDTHYDGVLDQTRAQVRELAWQGNLGYFGKWGEQVDAKLGQQVLTWGTGDYLFLNDLFAKDVQSFFAGRDDEYLKAPSMSAKFSGFYDWANIDIVFTPEFTPDIYINGDYFSFFLPLAAINISPGFDVKSPQLPSSPEYAIRIYKTIGSSELALYGYKGFHKSPSSFTEIGQAYFSALRVIGASAITPFAKGLLNVEMAFYDSTEDINGTNPLIPNNQTRWLVGYEQELIKNLTGSFQWYMERSADFTSLKASSLTPQFDTKRSRIVITQRLMYRALQQTLTFNAFNFYSTSDSDGYLKFSANYSPTDNWRISGGVNVFYGDQEYTFFNQFEDASNVFVRFRFFY
ncbi:MAG: hypothetical protein ACJAVV_001633 [Alphaproteobacteria bacterium]|jgi:hypothetical protein